MASRSLKAHFDGRAIHLDEPCDLAEGAQLIVTVLEPGPPEEERAGWIRLAAHGLARAYGESEPDYSIADLLP
jgi:hypothetical protein